VLEALTVQVPSLAQVTALQMDAPKDLPDGNMKKHSTVHAAGIYALSLL